MVKREPIRQLIKFSNYSLCITLPKEYIDNLGWQQGDRISFKLTNSKNDLILSKNHPEKPIQIERPKGTQEIPKSIQKSQIPPNNIQNPLIQNTNEIPSTTPIITSKIINEQIIPKQTNLENLEPIPPIS